MVEKREKEEMTARVESIYDGEDGNYGKGKRVNRSNRELRGSFGRKTKIGFERER